MVSKYRPTKEIKTALNLKLGDNSCKDNIWARGTCEWLLKDSKFEKWQHDKGNSLCTVARERLYPFEFPINRLIRRFGKHENFTRRSFDSCSWGCRKINVWHATTGFLRLSKSRPGYISSIFGDRHHIHMRENIGVHCFAPSGSQSRLVSRNLK